MLCLPVVMHRQVVDSAVHPGALGKELVEPLEDVPVSRVQAPAALVPGTVGCGRRHQELVGGSRLDTEPKLGTLPRRQTRLGLFKTGRSRLIKTT